MSRRTSLIKRIKIEIRRRLGACQFYIYFDPSKISSNIENEIQISVTQDKLCINSDEISTGLNLLPESLCGLSYSENTLTFRIRLNQELNSCNFTSPVFPSSNYEPAAQLGVGDSVMLQCLQCSLDVLRGSITISRITLESTNSVDVSDIFCHRDKKALKFEETWSTAAPADSQPLYYDTGCFTLPQLNDDNLATHQDKKVLHCRRCFAWLGLYTNAKKSSVQFWNDTVKFTNIPCDQTQEEISKCIFYSIIHKVIVNCLFPICNILMKLEANDKERCILISVLDRHLSVLECEQEFKMNETTYLKVSFKELEDSDTDNEDNIHQVVVVSKPTFLYVLRNLHSVSETAVGSDKIAFLRV